MWFKISLISSPPANGAFGISPRIARWKRAELGLAILSTGRLLISETLATFDGCEVCCSTPFRFTRCLQVLARPNH